ncbi:hypothetical protein [Lederbergia citrea]|uniref:DUF4352 domain-containing protein n=1 Tax=Lederbergia citrea TaxID=2833581 RepID=A0A942Z5N5_9BACI|nr:hypothetical protein [Lederbergia citrea]MBS4178345.1 hypothetical protein [Lederbergia citrea]MBS4223126.1 hypothetical protein [Lederbergia citrea]
MKKIYLLYFFFIIILLISCSNKEILKGDYVFNNKKSEKGDIEITIDEVTFNGNALNAPDYILLEFSITNNSDETINIIKKDISLLNEKGENFKFSDRVDEKENNTKHLIEPSESYSNSIFYDININHFEFNQLTIEFPVTKGTTEMVIPIDIKRDEFR